DSVNWAALSHAYGSAADVPDMLRGLTAPDRDRRENALDGLMGSIYHQGTVYDATAPAVPFLLELLAEPSVKGRARLLVLLRLLAEGMGYDEVHGRFRGEAEQASPEFRARLAAERVTRLAVRAAVRKGWPLYREFLTGRNEARRRAARRLA